MSQAHNLCDSIHDIDLSRMDAKTVSEVRNYRLINLHCRKHSCLCRLMCTGNYSKIMSIKTVVWLITYGFFLGGIYIEVIPPSYSECYALVLCYSWQTRGSRFPLSQMNLLSLEGHPWFHQNLHLSWKVLTA